MINVLFILDYVVLDKSQQQQFSKFFAQWTVINNNGSRQIIDAVIPAEYVDTAFDLLSAFPVETLTGDEDNPSVITEVNLHPSIIGKWNKDGSVIELNDTTEYIALLPPVITVNPDETITETPRTEAVTIHKFAGWGDKSWVAPVPPPVEVI